MLGLITPKNPFKRKNGGGGVGWGQFLSKLHTLQFSVCG